MLNRGATTAENWKVEGAKVWVPTRGRLRPARCQAGMGAGGVAPSRRGGPGVLPRKFFWKLMLNPAFLWFLRSLVGSRGRVYPSKQQTCQGLNQFQNFYFSAVVALLVIRTKNQSTKNYETCKLHASCIHVILVHINRWCKLHRVAYLLWNLLLFENYG